MNFLRLLSSGVELVIRIAERIHLYPERNRSDCVADKPRKGFLHVEFQTVAMLGFRLEKSSHTGGTVCHQLEHVPYATAGKGRAQRRSHVTPFLSPEREQRVEEQTVVGNILTEHRCTIDETIEVPYSDLFDHLWVTHHVCWLSEFVVADNFGIRKSIVQNFRSENQFDPFDDHHIENTPQKGGFDARNRFGQKVMILFRDVVIEQQDYGSHRQSAKQVHIDHLAWPSPSNAQHKWQREFAGLAL